MTSRTYSDLEIAAAQAGMNAYSQSPAAKEWVREEEEINHEGK